MTYRRLIPLVATLLLTLTLAACGVLGPAPEPTPTLFLLPTAPPALETPTLVPTFSASPTPLPPPTITPTPIDPVLLWTDTHCPHNIPNFAEEGIDIFCGYVSVPEDHANPAGRRIQIAVAVIPAWGDERAPEPLVMEQGGPGGSTLDSFGTWMLYPQFDEYSETRDLILVEQRGTRYSKPFLFCRDNLDMNVDLLDEQVPPEERAAREAEAAAACRRRFAFDGVDWSAYNSEQNALDIALVVSSLGYDRFDLYGVSYGSLLAQHAMRLYPERLRSVILDAVVPTSLNIMSTVPSSVSRSLRLLFDSCAADPACARAYPNLEQVFLDTVAYLNANPISWVVGDPEIGVTYDMLFTGDVFTDFVFSMLYSPDFLPQLPQIITDVSKGNYTFMHLSAPYYAVDRDFADGMYYAVLCAEDGGFNPAEVPMEGVYPELASHLADDWGQLCAAWDVAALGPEANAPVTVDIPTLVLNGEYDPITPPAFGERTASTLPGSTIVTFTGYGHGAIGTPCSDQIILDFLDDPASTPDTSCAGGEGFAFSVPERRSVTLVSVTLEGLGIRTVVPREWIETEEGVYLRFDSADDPVALIIDRPYRSGLSVDAFVRDVTQAYDSRNDPFFLLEVDSNGLHWVVYQVDVDGFPAVVAIAADDSGVQAYMILIAIEVRELIPLMNEVLVPAIEAFQLLN